MAYSQAAFCGILLSCISAFSATAEMNDTEAQLFELLKNKPEFIRAMPVGQDLQELVFKGNTVPGPLEWGTSPTEIEIKPVGLRTHIARNCSSDHVITVSDFLQAEYETKQTWEVGVGVELTHSVEVEAKLPVGGGKTTNEIKISFNGSKGGETSAGQKHRAGYSVPVKPGRELDVQLQVIEQIIEGTPFSIEMELLGRAEITHPSQNSWVRYRGVLPANKVSAGTEKNAAGTQWRDLYVCRAASSAHIGKVIGNRCHYGYGGKELSTTNLDILTVTGLEVDWMKRDDFEDAHDERSVAEGDAPVFYAGQENRPTGRYAGRTFVCRAEHKGNKHPGKIVNKDCMIGYGGKELQKSKYEVLMRGKAVENATAINLQDYLSPEERSFVVEGVFKDARSLSASTVLSGTRPVALEYCPGYVAPQENASVRDAEVEFLSPAAIGAEQIALSAASDDVAGGSPDVEAAISGTELVQISFGSQLETRARLVSRVLRDQRVDIFGADVTAVQQALNDAGATLEVDGYFGPKSAGALRKFQRENGLLADGVFGPRSQDALGL